MDTLSVLSDYAPLLDAEIPLFRAALGIALIEYPNMDWEKELRKVEALVRKASDRVASARSEEEAILLVNAYFFGDLGFRGNSDDYYNPRNSLLNEVLERRSGIPISISVIYLEVARGVGLNAFGVGFPGHFLVGYRLFGKCLYVDPFDAGRFLSRDDMQQILDRIYLGKVVFDESFLQPTNNRNILLRMLNNLKAIYLENRDHRKALEVLRCICAIDPRSAPDLRDRGLVSYQLGKYEDAVHDLSRYLAVSGDPPDGTAVREVLKRLSSLLKKLQ